jgi:pimeloyl-ACP methyl ester carboxylesterase
MAQMAADAAAVMDAASVAQAHVFGISMGGMIAQEFALGYPQRVRSLVLGCTSCGGRNAARADDKVLQIIKSRAAMTPDDAFHCMVPYIYDASTPPERIAEDLEMRRRGFPTAPGYLGQLEAIFSWTSFDRLQDIQAPTLIIHGEADQLVPPENARILARHIPGSRLVMLPQASHIFPTDQPEAAQREILGFLASVA